MNEKPPHSIENDRIGLLCLIAIIAVLVGTLWPFNPWPTNKVMWLEDANGLRFDRAGVVVSKSPLQLPHPTFTQKSCSIELLVRPANVGVSDTILGFYIPDDPTHLLVRQWTDGLLVTHDSTDSQGKVKQTKFDVDHAFQTGKLVLLTITSSPNGSVVYRNATHPQSFPRFTISPNELAGQIVLGTSPADYRPWLGDIRGLAIYAKELTPAEVASHYAEWSATQITNPSDADGAIARYRFTERAGREIHSDVASGPTLEIAASFNIPHKAMLKSAVKEFDPTRLYVNDVLLNIAGFIPLGVILCVYFSRARSRSRAIVCATLFGALLSFTIEVLQAYIPRRVSGTTDIITNTVGTLLGAAIVNPAFVKNILQAAKFLPSPKIPPTQAH